MTTDDEYIERLKFENSALRDECASLRGQIKSLRGGDVGPYASCTECDRAMVWDHAEGSWMCPRCVLWRMKRAEEERDRLRSEITRLSKYAKDVWAECNARGEILDAIQAECGGSWWYDALYKMRAMREELWSLRIPTEPRDSNFAAQPPSPRPSAHDGARPHGPENEVDAANEARTEGGTFQNFESTAAPPISPSDNVANDLREKAEPAREGRDSSFARKPTRKAGH